MTCLPLFYDIRHELAPRNFAYRIYYIVLCYLTKTMIYVVVVCVCVVFYYYYLKASRVTLNQ